MIEKDPSVEIGRVETEIASEDVDTAIEENLNVDDIPNETTDENRNILPLPKVRILTLDDLKEGKYTLDDVVLPLPGTDVEYPKNEVGAKYAELLKNDGLDITALYRGQKEFCLRGEYRKLITKVSDLEWEIYRYENDTEQLSTTDFDQIDGKSFPNMDDIDRVKGSKTALVLNFSLPSSSYATMLLRELTRQSFETITNKVT